MKITTIADDKIRKIIRIVVLLLLIFYPIMAYYFYISGDPLEIMESQLSFDAITLRLEYFIILTEGNMDAYRTAQTLDFGFMALYGALMCLISIRWANKIQKLHPNDILWYKIGYVFAILVIVAAFCDVIENIYILKMIGTQPIFNFPDNWAIIHSTFALIKWIILFSFLTWYVLVRLKYRK